MSTLTDSPTTTEAEEALRRRLRENAAFSGLGGIVGAAACAPLVEPHEGAAGYWGSAQTRHEERNPHAVILIAMQVPGAKNQRQNKLSLGAIALRYINVRRNRLKSH